MKMFKTPQLSLGNLDAEAAARVITAATDVALLLDGDGVIRDLALAGDSLASSDTSAWVGQSWSDTVTVESRPKVEALLKEAGSNKASPRWRQVNHPSQGKADVPVLYSAIQIGKRGRVVAFGRDLRPVAALQQQLLESQLSMEREYSRLRHAETRYRLLFQLATEAVLILDAPTQRVVEANPSALRALADAGKRIVGRTFPTGFDAESTDRIQQLLVTIKAAGRGEDVVATTSDGQRRFAVSASLFRHETATFFLVRLGLLSERAAKDFVPRARSHLLEVVDKLPDGFVVTDLDGIILTANVAFLDLAQLATEEQARGQPLSHWLGRPGVDMEVLVSSLRQHGSVRMFSTLVRGQFGSTADIEASAVAVPEGEQPCYGFSLRNVGPRHSTPARATRELPHSAQQLTELIGRVPLKDLVRDTTDVVEKLCIETALKLTGDNRASAAEMLGLSRQSLYVKLRRFGLSDVDEEAEADPAD